ncbi:MAG: DUF2634 domain-containing protein [Clostridiaceae bacterium]
MFPTTEVNTSTTEATTKGKSFLFDFEKGDFVIKDGKLVEVSGDDAIKVWIEKVIRTEKFKFKIYQRDDEFEYGVTLQELMVGYEYPLEYVEAEIKREVTEALLNHSSIENLSDWSIEKNNPVLNIGFRVVLTDGSTLESEVIL